MIVVAFVCRRASSEPKAADPPGTDITAQFKDKILLLEVNRSNALETKSNSVVIDKVRLTSIAGRYFVLGSGVAPDDGESTWYKDVLVGVPWESVVRFHAMTKEQFADYVKLWKEHAE
jgi:hypothetical protein